MLMDPVTKDFYSEAKYEHTWKYLFGLLMVWVILKYIEDSRDILLFVLTNQDMLDLLHCTVRIHQG